MIASTDPPSGDHDPGSGRPEPDVTAGSQRVDPVRVFVCDDSFGYPMLVRTWLEESAGVELAGLAITAGELLGALPRSRAHVVLLDIMLPEGLVSRELVDEVRRASPGIRVILASAMPDEILRAEVTRTGADASCSKLASRDELLSLILA